MNEKRPRILIFSALYLPHVGGVERFTEKLSYALRDQGLHVTIVTNNIFGLDGHEEINGDFDIYRLPSVPLMGGRLPVPRSNGKYRRLLDEIAGIDADFILINTRFYPLSRLGAQIASRNGVRPVLLDHGSDYLTLNNAILDKIIRRYEHHVTERLKKAADIDFYGISRKSADWLKTFGIDAKGVISNAIDAEEFLSQSSGRDFRRELGIGDDELIVLFAGRLVPEKGVSIVLEVAEKSADMQKIQFIVAGDGPLRHAVTDHGSNNVHYVGQLDDSDISALMLDSDIILLPSRSEGFSTALLEAAATGTIPIATDVGGAREIITDSDHGTILGSAEPSEIIKHLERYASDAALMQRSEESLKELARREFRWESTAETVIESCKKANLGQI